MHYQYEITIKDNTTGRKFPKLYAGRSQIGPKSYAQQCLDKKVVWVQDRANRGGKDITITTDLVPCA